MLHLWHQHWEIQHTSICFLVVLSTSSQEELLTVGDILNFSIQELKDQCQIVETTSKLLFDFDLNFSKGQVKFYLHQNVFGIHSKKMCVCVLGTQTGAIFFRKYNKILGAQLMISVSQMDKLVETCNN